MLLLIYLCTSSTATTTTCLLACLLTYYSKGLSASLLQLHLACLAGRDETLKNCLQANLLNLDLIMWKQEKKRRRKENYFTHSELRDSDSFMEQGSQDNTALIEQFFCTHTVPWPPCLTVPFSLFVCCQKWFK